MYGAAGMVGVILFLAIVAHAYLGTRDSGVSHAQLVKDIADVMKQIDDRTQSRLDKIEQDRKNVTTPQQIVQAIPRYTPDVRPILVIPNGVATQPSNVPVMALSDAPSSVKAGDFIIPKEQVPAYWTSVTKCAEDSAKRDQCEQKLPLETKRANDAEKAMNGGGFFHRLKAGAKHSLCGAGAGSAGVMAGQKSSPTVGAITGGALFIGCELLAR